MNANFQRIRDAALSRIDDVLAYWLPGGKRLGKEYLALNPRRPDTQTGSFSVSLKTGAWVDLASGIKGGDLVGLVKYLETITYREAAKRLADFLGLRTETEADSPLPENWDAVDALAAKYRERIKTLQAHLAALEKMRRAQVSPDEILSVVEASESRPLSDSGDSSRLAK